MRPRLLLREIVRNTVSGTTRCGILFVVSALVFGSLALADIVSISQILRDAADYRSSGSSVRTLALPGRIDGESCEALSRLPGIAAAGAMRSSGQVTATTLPGEPLDLFVTTPGFAEVLGAKERSRDAGVSVSDEIVSVLGSEEIPLSPTVTVRSTYAYPSDGRRAGFGWAVLSPTISSDGPFDECWASVWPERADIRALMLAAVDPRTVSAPEVPPQFSQLNTKNGVAFAGARAFSDRITRHASSAAFIVGAVIAALAVRARRVEIASNLHAGAQRWQVLVQLLAETSLWSVPASALSWTGGVCAAALLAPGELPALAARSFEIVVVALMAALAGAAIAFSSVREAKLWRYVKSR